MINFVSSTVFVVTAPTQARQRNISHALGTVCYSNQNVFDAPCAFKSLKTLIQNLAPSVGLIKSPKISRVTTGTRPKPR